MSESFFTNDTVINFLLWAFGATGTALIGVICYLALGVIHKLDEQNAKAETQFGAFGRQLTTVKDLLLDDIHKHDVRITRLEEWRKSTTEGDD
ncbi:MAG: hypothetical protein IT518_08505 [Burkholderiales bacterium]|nr:hypothetical protein [Burkholderiales bacterium]